MESAEHPSCNLEVTHSHCNLVVMRSILSPLKPLLEPFECIGHTLKCIGEHIFPPTFCNIFKEYEITHWFKILVNSILIKRTIFFSVTFVKCHSLWTFHLHINFRTRLEKLSVVDRKNLESWKLFPLRA